MHISVAVFDLKYKWKRESFCEKSCENDDDFVEADIIRLYKIVIIFTNFFSQKDSRFHLYFKSKTATLICKWDAIYQVCGEH